MLKRKTLEQHEVTRLLAELRDRKSAARDYFIVRFLLNTGLRVGELVSLDVGDVRDRGAITFRGKGSKVRTVPLNKRTRSLVADLRESGNRNRGTPYPIPARCSPKTTARTPAEGGSIRGDKHGVPRLRNRRQGTAV